MTTSSTSARGGGDRLLDPLPHDGAESHQLEAIRLDPPGHDLVVPRRRRFDAALDGSMALFVAPLVAAVAVAATILDRPTFRWLTAEDSLLEWAQFACYLGAAVVGAWVALRLVLRKGPRAGVVLFALFALACFFIAGEEIAWGQRILGLDTPEALEAINHQGEITAHNISAIQGLFNVGFLIAGLFGAFSPWFLRRWRNGARPELVALVVPPLYLSSWFFVVAAYKGLRMAFFPNPRFLVVKYGELPELCMAAALLLLALAAARLLRRQELPVASTD
ncbi:MAG: putative Pectate lyase [Acidimicrobiales bacterium]|nr:putative Pectate lyase [Acidimicrobiales bacterium]